MLSLRALVVVALSLSVALARAQAWADNVDDDDLHRPHRLTVGVADDLLGQLGKDGETLYFVSNRDTTNQLLAQDMRDGRVWQLFDDGADVTWPRVSPNGRALLYISFRENAAGELCVRRLPEGDARTCLASSDAALQAEWIGEDRIALISRRAIESDLRVLSVRVGEQLTAAPLLSRNMTSPAISPDGRWLVYVPVARTVKRVGPAFAAHAAETLEAVPLAQASTAKPVPLALQLPGKTGQPVFAKDGRALYVVQFFTDTNHDGAVDASDRGVLFRVPLSFERGAPVASRPEQLTDTAWNCEYPAPFTDRLIATCSRGTTLDVYALPLAGEVPEEWSMEQLERAIEDVDTLIDEQLLWSRRLARERSANGQARALLALALVHFEREEFRAAEYYAAQIDTLADPATAGASSPLRLLVGQRRSQRRREQGRLLEGFARESAARLAQLDPAHTSNAVSTALTRIARAEIFDSLGDKGAARAELEAVTFDASTPFTVVEVYYRQADALYRLMDDRQALIALCRRLARDPSFKPDEQLRYAQAAARAIQRGLSYADAEAHLTAAQAALRADEAELSFALDLARKVLAIRDAHAPAAVSDALLALYGAQTRPGRRRVLIVQAVQRADDVDADDVVDALAQRDVHDVARGTHERGEAEDVYERLILARAYERALANRYAEARADFDAVAAETGSLEAEVGAIDMRLKLRETPESIAAHYNRPGVEPYHLAFAKAYLIARRLPRLDGEERMRAAAEALAALDASWARLYEERMAQALYGSLLHEEYLASGELDDAERANSHYLVALELMGQNPRFAAMILGELGVLHTDVGNYRIALGYLEERQKYPYEDDEEGLDVLLSKAQALLHVGRETEAVQASEAALAMIGRNPALGPYRLLALDLAAVDNLAANDFARALQLYDAELPLLEEAGARDRLVLHVARAASALGAGEPARALEDLDVVDGLLRDPGTLGALHWPHAAPEHVVRAYRLIANGLRAGAQRALGKLDLEAAALTARRGILAEQLDETSRMEIGREQMLADAQLAWNAQARHDVTAARGAVAQALATADDLHERGDHDSDRAQLDVLWLAAQLSVSMHQQLVPDLGKRIDAAAAELRARKEPSLRAYLRWLEIYAPLVAGLSR